MITTADLIKKPLRDTILRDSCRKEECRVVIGWYVEMCDFEDSKLKKTWFDMASTNIDDDYDSNFRVNFEI